MVEQELEQKPRIIRGFCISFHEQGRRLAVYDSSVAPLEHEQLRYEGLHFLKPGDKLKVFSPDNPENVVWEGEITNKQLPPDGRLKPWANQDPSGERKRFIQYFSNEFPAELAPTEKPTQSE